MIRRELHIDVTGNYGSILITYAGGSISVHSVKPDMVVGDKFDLRLYFWQRATNGTAVVADPGDSAQINFAGRPAGIPAGSDALFHSSDFTQTALGIWDGTVDLNTQEFIDHLAATPAGDKVIRCEIEIRNSNLNTRRLSLQFDAHARRNAWNDQDAPTALPTPQQWLMGSTAPVIGANVTYAGSGVPEFEQWAGFYAQDQLLDGKNSYLSESGTNVVRWRSSGGGKWTYEGSGQVEVYYSTSQVAEPWMATDWKISGSATPEPNFSVSNGTTQAPPYFRVAGGKLYVQDAGVWKSADLTVVS
jgi:hypothetical protein